MGTQAIAYLPDEITTWGEAELWKQVHGRSTDHPLTTLLADALRQRGAIDPQTYTAIWGNTDYLYDTTLWGSLPLTETEMAWLGEVTREHRA